MTEVIEAQSVEDAQQAIRNSIVYMLTRQAHHGGNHANRVRELAEAHALLGGLVAPSTKVFGGSEALMN